LNATPAVREKMLGLDLATKQSMLVQATSKPAKPEKKTFSVIKKARSFASLRSASPKHYSSEDELESQAMPDGFVLINPMPSSPVKAAARPRARSRSNSASGSAGPMDNSPEAWAMILQTTNHKTLLPSHLIKLRMLLRNEKPEWVERWIKCNGYRGLLERLNELLEMEWREEQRDDGLLYELLKCTKALTHSEAGKEALAAFFPNPHRPLIQLLYTDKKPGDLGPRQIMLELVQALFDQFPGGAPCPAPLSPTVWNTPATYERPVMLMSMRSPDSGYASNSPDLTNRDSSAIHQLVRSLMLGPPNEKEEALHEFVRESHTPRPFKRWIAELTGVLSDCFWIFCHSSNVIRDFTKLDLGKMTALRVPAGHTGGVEFEFMSYAVRYARGF
jgi:hypothetical protein